jgi:hypothetical protein
LYDGLLQPAADGPQLPSGIRSLSPDGPPMESPPPRATLREQLLAIARQLQPFAEVDPALPVTVVFRCGDATLEIKIDPASIGAAHTGLPQMEQDLLRVATRKPESAKTLARLAGKTMNSHINKALAELCRKRLLLRMPEGYCLPE